MIRRENHGTIRAESQCDPAAGPLPFIDDEPGPAVDPLQHRAEGTLDVAVDLLEPGAPARLWREAVAQRPVDVRANPRRRVREAREPVPAVEPVAALVARPEPRAARVHAPDEHVAPPGVAGSLIIYLLTAMFCVATSCWGIGVALIVMIVVFSAILAAILPIVMAIFAISSSVE